MQSRTYFQVNDVFCFMDEESTYYTVVEARSHSIDFQIILLKKNNDDNVCNQKVIWNTKDSRLYYKDLSYKINHYATNHDTHQDYIYFLEEGDYYDA